MNSWIVYVAGKKADKNYQIGKSKGIWGLKKINKNSDFKKMKDGDDIIFVKEINWISSMHGPRPNGFPKFFKDSNNFKGQVKEILFGKVTKGYYQDTEKVWDDDVYQYRFNFKPTSCINNHIFTKNEFGAKFVDATFKSIKSSGDVCIYSDPVNPITPEKLVSYDDYDSYGEDIDYTASEGKIFTQLHKKKERNKTIVKKKKEQVLKKHGCLKCEICSFDFVEKYGHNLGHEFSECHHINPIADNDEVNTKLSDLIIICPNCHRMIHRRRPWLTVDDLKNIYNQHNKI